LRLSSKKKQKHHFDSLVLKNPKDSIINLADIKSYLDEHNRHDAEMGWPLTINMHLAARKSPFSKNADMINLRGIVVVLSLLLICSSAEKIIKVFAKDGWVVWNAMTKFINIWGGTVEDYIMIFGFFI